MQTFLNLRQYLVDLLLEWKIFQIKVAEEIKTEILYPVTFSLKSCRLWHNVEKYVAARKAAENMAHALCMLDKQDYKRGNTRPCIHIHFHTQTHTHAHAQ